MIRCRTCIWPKHLRRSRRRARGEEGIQACLSVGDMLVFDRLPSTPQTEDLGNPFQLLPLCHCNDSRGSAALRVHDHQQSCTSACWVGAWCGGWCLENCIGRGARISSCLQCPYLHSIMLTPPGPASFLIGCCWGCSLLLPFLCLSIWGVLSTLDKGHRQDREKDSRGS